LEPNETMNEEMKEKVKHYEGMPLVTKYNVMPPLKGSPAVGLDELKDKVWEAIRPYRPHIMRQDIDDFFEVLFGQANHKDGPSGGDHSYGVIQQTLMDGIPVCITSFGTFTPSIKSARTFNNMGKGKINFPSRWWLNFTVSRPMAAKVEALRQKSLNKK